MLMIQVALWNLRVIKQIKFKMKTETEKIMPLTAREEDILLEEERERYFDNKAKAKEEVKEIFSSKGFGKDGKCQFCGKGKAEVPIVDSETDQEVWICEKCDEELFDESNYLTELEEERVLLKKYIFKFDLGLYREKMQNR